MPLVIRQHESSLVIHLLFTLRHAWQRNVREGRRSSHPKTGSTHVLQVKNIDFLFFFTSWHGNFLFFFFALKKCSVQLNQDESWSTTHVLELLPPFGNNQIPHRYACTHPISYPGSLYNLPILYVLFLFFFYTGINIWVTIYRLLCRVLVGGYREKSVNVKSKQNAVVTVWGVFVILPQRVFLLLFSNWVNLTS